MKSKVTVVKVGGNIIHNEKLLNAFLADFAKMDGAKILVHGGGKLATEFSKRLGVDTVMINGRRITSAENLEVAIMVYAGLVNKRIVATLQGNHCNALGLSGSDANCIRATKRPVSSIDFGWVGDVDFVNAEPIVTFLSNGFTPIFCAISYDGNDQLLNTNADTIAAEVAIAMSDHYETELIYCFEKNGVLRNVDVEDSLIPTINRKEFDDLKNKGIIQEGMLPKMANCFHALANNVTKVIIGRPAVINRSVPHTTIKL